MSKNGNHARILQKNLEKLRALVEEAVKHKTDDEDGFCHSCWRQGGHNPGCWVLRAKATLKEIELA